MKPEFEKQKAETELDKTINFLRDTYSIEVY